mgnify:CR=1 FL=1
MSLRAAPAPAPGRAPAPARAGARNALRDVLATSMGLKDTIQELENSIKRQRTEIAPKDARARDYSVCGVSLQFELITNYLGLGSGNTLFRVEATFEPKEAGGAEATDLLELFNKGIAPKMGDEPLYRAFIKRNKFEIESDGHFKPDQETLQAIQRRPAITVEMGVDSYEAMELSTPRIFLAILKELVKPL